MKDKWGYFDRQGKVIVEPKYDDAQEFSQGLAAINSGAKSTGFPRPFIKEGGKWGFIDKTGRLVIPLQFDWVNRKGFSEGFAAVKAADKFSYIDNVGKVGIMLKSKPDDSMRTVWWAEGFTDGLALVHTLSGDDKLRLGFIDKTGKFVIAPQFSEARGFSEGLAAVSAGSKWGYVDRKGRIVIKPQFDDAKDFSEGLAPVRKGEHWIDKHAKVVIRGRFNDADGFTGGLARVHEGGEFVRTHDGPTYWSGGAWFYINQKGEKVRRCRTDDAESGPGYGKEHR